MHTNTKITKYNPHKYKNNKIQCTQIQKNNKIQPTQIQKLQNTTHTNTKITKYNAHTVAAN